MKGLRTWGWGPWFHTVCPGPSCCPSPTLLSLLCTLLCHISLPRGCVPALLHLKPTALPTTGVFHLCIKAQLDSELVFEISNNLITFINSILLRLSQSY